MRVNIDLSSIQAKDTIIAANNRQALAIKKSIPLSSGTSKMPKIFSYQSWIEKFWRSHKPTKEYRLLSQLELRFLLKKFCKESSAKNPETFIEELIKCYRLCKSYGIPMAEIKTFPSTTSKLYAELIDRYEKFKNDNKCIDQTDIFSLSLPNLKNDHDNEKRYYHYGFNEPNPEQKELFKVLECSPLANRQIKSHSQNYSFIDQESELMTIAKWAKEINTNNPEKKIGIVIPNLNDLQHIVRASFDLEFSSLLIETHQKPYNISLGIPLSNYPLINNLFSIMRLSSQLINGRVEHELLIQVVTSPYIKGARNEQNNRALLVNKILKIGFKESKAKKIIELCSDSSLLKEIFISISTLECAKKSTLEDSLDLINSILMLWGFASDRGLSSSEYQVFEKYQMESLILNKMSIFHKKLSLEDVLEILTAHMNAVIFQPQSGPANIHILGSLEAEGLFFDYAWVSSMTNDFLPGKIKMPLFIPPKTSIEYALPSTSFTLITKESDTTLNNLLNLSSHLVISYSKTSNNRDELPTPYINFEDYPDTIAHETLPKEMELIEDWIAPEIDNFEINKGVNTLQDQMSCSFKGFVNRLNIQEFNEPQIGLSRLEQGNLVHKILESFFNEISTSSILKNLTEDKLQDQINKHIGSAIQLISQSNFKSIEKERLTKIINEYIKLEKNRKNFQVIKTESESKVDVNGLKFSTRIDRMDQMEDGTKLIIDYKTGQNVNLSQLIGDPLDQAQLPIYAITNPVDGIAFATVNSKDCQFKAITKNKDDLPITQQAIKRMPEWNEQVSKWKLELNSASQKFQEGVAEVLPTSNACDYCDFDLLCRFEKSGNNR